MKMVSSHQVSSLLILFCSFFVFIQLSGALTPEEDEITYLPGLVDEINFKQYAGYMTVDESHGRRLFYWFVESQNDPAYDPVILWLNGGPGCSSLGGFFTELGPFWPTANQTLLLNQYSWNKVANVLFLESPAGVGFSYSNNEDDYVTGDARTANDSYTFLLQFFQNYPQFRKNAFWVSGESYAGHYVPQLSQRILQGNAVSSLKINLKGYLAGNAWTDAAMDNYGAVYFWVTHALISQATFDQLNDTCDFSSIGPLSAHAANNDLKKIPDPEKCEEAQYQAFDELGNINIYDIYADVCLSSSGKPSGHAQGQQLLRFLGRSKSPLNRLASQLAEGTDPCIGNFLDDYLNDPEVQLAIHARPTIWDQCSSVVDYSYEDLLTSVLPVIRNLTKSGLSILVYSGDIDAIVPVTGTRSWLPALGLAEREAWRPWISSVGQVAGYVTVYSGGVTFATVRGAGHMVPGGQPGRALDLLYRFIHNQPL